MEERGGTESPPAGTTRDSARPDRAAVHRNGERESGTDEAGTERRLKDPAEDGDQITLGPVAKRFQRKTDELDAMPDVAGVAARHVAQEPGSIVEVSVKDMPDEVPRIGDVGSGAPQQGGGAEQDHPGPEIVRLRRKGGLGQRDALVHLEAPLLDRRYDTQEKGQRLRRIFLTPQRGRKKSLRREGVGIGVDAVGPLLGTGRSRRPDERAEVRS